jgi:hypothetical protein
MGARFREVKPLAIVAILVGFGLLLEGYRRAVARSGGGMLGTSGVAILGVVVLFTGVAFLMFSKARPPK